MTSRERVLAALNHTEPDRVPIMFWGQIAPLRLRWRDRFERVKCLRELGVDDQMSVGTPWPYHPSVNVRVARDDSPPDFPLLIKDIGTPVGRLRMAVRKTPDYPWSDPPLVSDHNWSRATEFLVKGPDDLPKLRYLLHDPGKAELDSFLAHARMTRDFCRAEEVLLSVSAASPSNYAMGLVGAQNLMMYSVDDRGFVEELLELICEWSVRRLEPMLALGVDTVQFSGIYESTAFWSPADFGQLFAPHVRRIAGIVHQAGAKFHYFSDAHIMGQLETFRDLGVDALSYLNPPPMGDADLGEIKRRVGDRICLWGGISAPITLEQGSPEEVRQAVIDAIGAAAHGGGYILATADAILQESAYDNLMTMIDTGLRFGTYPIAL
jgi:uroporphyrinogen decarboxylase